MRKLLTLILILCTIAAPAQMRGGAQYDPGAIRSDGTNASDTVTFNSLKAKTSGGLTIKGSGDATAMTIGAGGGTAVSTADGLNVGGVLKTAAGTSAAPAYSFSSDPDTGMFSAGANVLKFGTNGTVRMELDGSGNVGIAVTPKAWASNFKVLQIYGTTAIAQNGFGDSYFGNNWYYDGTNTRYISDEPMNIYSMVNGNHIWESAPSGTGGDIAVPTESMRITNGGNVLIATSIDTGEKLQVNGSMRLIGMAAPTPTEGGIYFNSSDKHLYVYNGTGWVQLDN